MLSEIKRKSGDNNLNDEFSTQQNENNDDSGQLLQNGSGNNLNLDTDGMKSDVNTQIISEVSNLKSKQTNLEKAMTMLIQQHETLIRENKILWDEIRRQNEQDDLRSEKIMMVLAFFLNRNNQFNGGNNNNGSLQNQRSLALQQINNRRTFQPNLEDIQEMLTGQAYQRRDNKNDLQSIYKTLLNLNNNRQMPFDMNENGNSFQQLPFNQQKKGTNEAFVPQFNQKQIKKLLESYQQSGDNGKEIIEQYIQSMVSGNNNKMENRSNILPIENKNDRISVFENPPSKKRVCDESLHPIRNHNSSDQSNLGNQMKMQDNNNDNIMVPSIESSLAYNKNNNNQLRISQQQSLPKVQSATSIDHPTFEQTVNSNNNPFFKDQITYSPNHLPFMSGNNPNALTLSRNNSYTLGGGFVYDKMPFESNISQIHRGSPSPQRPGNQDLTHSHNNIGDLHLLSPYYGNIAGSFTPERHYDDEDYAARSRRSSFDKNHDQSNNFSNIN